MTPAPAITATEPPKFVGLSHVSLPARSLEEAKKFYTEVLGGRLTTNIADFASVEVAGVHFGMAEISVSLPRPDAEYPHYALLVEPEELLRLRERLVDYGIPVGPIWTRRETEALMFFKDPSGNLFELLCRGAEFPEFPTYRTPALALVAPSS
ncbi:MAG: VOC family protein, partial [Chloroflexi bacterium]|nr:VOC family protein [Chloroflexota bacterium]